MSMSMGFARIRLHLGLLAMLILLPVLLLGQFTGVANAASSRSMLPGERILPSGVSSYLFGINQMTDYAPTNLENTPAAQQALRRAHFTFIRTFFNYRHYEWPYDHSTITDADIERRLEAVENSGSQCMGVLSVSPSSRDNSPLWFMDHLLTYAETTGHGNRCLMWEFGNETDFEGMSMPQYLASWNQDIPYLRARHPKATFIGAVIYNPKLDEMQTFLEGVKRSGVMPDAVSYHDYPCWGDPDYYISHDTTYVDQSNKCDYAIKYGYAGYPGYTQRIRNMKSLVYRELGYNIPVGVTEWNVSPNTVNMVYANGRAYYPLTADASYQQRFIPQMYAAMAAGGLDFAATFDAFSGAGQGTGGSFDLFNPDGTPKPWLQTYANTIAAYSR